MVVVITDILDESDLEQYKKIECKSIRWSALNDKKDILTMTIRFKGDGKTVYMTDNRNGKIVSDKYGKVDEALQFINSMVHEIKKNNKTGGKKVERYIADRYGYGSGSYFESITILGYPKSMKATRTKAPHKSGQKSTMKFLENSVRNMF